MSSTARCVCCRQVYRREGMVALTFPSEAQHLFCGWGCYDVFHRIVAERAEDEGEPFARAVRVQERDVTVTQDTPAERSQARLFDAN